jgi:hypothetical protein
MDSKEPRLIDECSIHTAIVKPGLNFAITRAGHFELLTRLDVVNDETNYD